MADKVATWGCVLVVDKVAKFEASGRMREPARCTVATELRAMGNALHAAVKAGHVAKGDTVRFISDCSWAVGLVKGKVTPGPKKTAPKIQHRQALGVLRKIAADAGICLTAAGVKGHQPATSKCPHAEHNRRADKLCQLAKKEGEPEA